MTGPGQSGSTAARAGSTRDNDPRWVVTRSAKAQPPELARAWAMRAGMMAVALFALVYLFLTPPFQVPDETAHFDRAIDLSYGHVIGSVSPRLPGRLLEMEHALPGFIEHQTGEIRWIATDDLTRWLHVGLLDAGEATTANPAANLYTPVPYLLAAAVIAPARFLDLPPLVVFYCGRLANLIGFMVLVWASLRVLPDFWLQIAALALMPMTLHQAASLSADSLTIGSTFFLISYVLKLAFDPGIVRLTRRHLTILTAAILLNSLMKFNVWLLLLTLLIPSSRFPRRLRSWQVFAVMLLMASAAGLGWQLLNQENARTYVAWKQQANIDVAANTTFSRQHTAIVIEDIGQSLAVNGERLTQMFVGYFGYISVPLPDPWVWTYLGLLALVALTQSWRGLIGVRSRLVMALICLASVISIFVLIFNFEMPRTLTGEHPLMIAPIGAMQGRYLIPFAPLMLIVFSNRRLRLAPRVMTMLVLIVAGGAHAAAWKAIYNEYYAGAFMKTVQVHAVQWPNGAIYLRVDDTLHLIPNLATLERLALKEPIVKGNPEAEAKLIGAPLPELPGRVLKTKTDPGIYYVEKGKRHAIPNPATQVALGLTQVSVVDKRVLEAIPLGIPVPVVEAQQK